MKKRISSLETLHFFMKEGIYGIISILYMRKIK
jgi:hypothetical protein